MTVTSSMMDQVRSNGRLPMNAGRLALFLILLPFSLFGQTSASPTATITPGISSLPPASPAPEGEELTKLLKDFLAGASRNDLAAHERFWADDLIYTGSVGRRLGKSDLLREVQAEGAPKSGDETTIYSAEDIRIQQYGNTAIVAFRLVGTTTKRDKTEIANYLNSGMFLKRDGRWQVVNWQATKMPKGEGKE
jgi:ketosteroid isomerase-like protein